MHFKELQDRSTPIPPPPMISPRFLKNNIAKCPDPLHMQHSYGKFSRLYIPMANSLDYKQQLLSVNYSKVYFYLWRLQILMDTFYFIYSWKELKLFVLSLVANGAIWLSEVVNWEVIVFELVSLCLVV